MKIKSTLILILLFLVYGNLYSANLNKIENSINNILKDSPKKEKKKNKDSTDSKSNNEQNQKDDSPNLTMSAEDEVILKTAIDQYNNELYNYSLKKFQSILNKYPNSQYADTSKIWIGKIYIRLNKLEKAIEIFNQIKKDSGEYPASLFFIAKCYRAKGERVKAIEEFQLIFSQFPNHDLADNSMLETAKLYLSKGMGTQALEISVKLIKYYKNRDTIDDAYYLIGKIFQRDPILKDFEKAKNFYKLFLKKAKSGQKFFIDSPLLKRVKNDLTSIENSYLKYQ